MTVFDLALPSALLTGVIAVGFLAGQGRGMSPKAFLRLLWLSVAVITLAGITLFLMGSDPGRLAPAVLCPVIAASIFTAASAAWRLVVRART